MKDKSVKEIKEIVENLNEDQYGEYIDILNEDSRKSVQNIAKSLIKKLDKIKKEEERLEFINTFENEGYANGYLYIGGVDEAGRGPLAGPVVASVVVFEKGTKIPYINDSKKLSEAKREELFDIIKEQALDYGIGIVDNEEIDEYNILNGVIFMDLSQLGESAQYMVPLIILFCMCIGYVIKTSLDFIENKYIPLIMVSIGIGLNIWINKQVTAEIVVAGALSGLASIGTHQTCKNLNHSKKDQENNKDDNKDE